MGIIRAVRKGSEVPDGYRYPWESNLSVIALIRHHLSGRKSATFSTAHDAQGTPFGVTPPLHTEPGQLHESCVMELARSLGTSIRAARSFVGADGRLLPQGQSAGGQHLMMHPFNDFFDSVSAEKLDHGAFAILVANDAIQSMMHPFSWDLLKADACKAAGIQVPEELNAPVAKRIALHHVMLLHKCHKMLPGAWIPDSERRPRNDHSPVLGALYASLAAVVRRDTVVFRNAMQYLRSWAPAAVAKVKIAAGQLAFEEACRPGQNDVLKRMLQSKQHRTAPIELVNLDSIDAAYSSITQGLVFACIFGHREIAKQLRSALAMSNQSVPREQLLAVACSANQVEIVRFMLLDAGRWSQLGPISPEALRTAFSSSSATEMLPLILRNRAAKTHHALTPQDVFDAVSYCLDRRVLHGSAAQLIRLFAEHLRKSPRLPQVVTTGAQLSCSNTKHAFQCLEILSCVFSHAWTRYSTWSQTWER